MGLLGKDSDEDQQSAYQEQQMHQQLQASSQQRAQNSPDHFEETVETGLDPETIDLLDNLLSKDFVLANFTDAEVHEVRWMARVVEKMLADLHPPEKSVLQGEFRKFLMDDERQGISSLSSAERLIVRQLIMGHIARATRGRDGWQQEQFDKSISVSEVRDSEPEDEGWF